MEKKQAAELFGYIQAFREWSGYDVRIVLQGVIDGSWDSKKDSYKLEAVQREIARLDCLGKIVQLAARKLRELTELDPNYIASEKELLGDKLGADELQKLI